MAISIASLTFSNAADTSNVTMGNYYETASISPTASRLLVLCMVRKKEPSSNGDPTISWTGSALGSSWNMIGTPITYRIDGGYTNARMWVFAAATGSSPGTGTIRMTAPDSTWINCSWIVFEANGTDVGNGVAQTFVQYPTQSGYAAGDSLTLAPEGHADNRPFLTAAVNWDLSSPWIGTRTNWTRIEDTYGHAENVTFDVQWRSDQFETTASATFPGPNYYGFFAFELKAAAAGGAVVSDPFGMSGFFGA